MLRIAAIVLVIGASLAAGPAAAQFGNQAPPRPPADIPNGGFPAQPPPVQSPGQQQYPPPPPSAGPPPSGIQAQPLPPPPGAVAAPPPAQRARVSPPPANPQPPGNPQQPANSQQPANPPPPQPADAAPQSDDTVVTETPTQKIPNARAVFSGLDKITGRIISFDAAIGETVQFGALQVTARACYTRPPTEATNTDAFIDVDEVTLKGEIKRIFTGWMFASSPGLHAVEHPIYDVWLTDCSQPIQAPAPVAQSTTPSPAPAAPAPQRPRPPPAPRQVAPAPAPAPPAPAPPAR
jgi:hypothetical protein